METVCWSGYPVLRVPVFVPVNVTIRLPQPQDPAVEVLNRLWLAVQILGGFLLAVKTAQEISRRV
jgi:hypothetical protein